MFVNVLNTALRVLYFTMSNLLLLLTCSLYLVGFCCHELYIKHMSYVQNQPQNEYLMTKYLVMQYLRVLISGTIVVCSSFCYMMKCSTSLVHMCSKLPVCIILRLKQKIRSVFSHYYSINVVIVLKISFCLKDVVKDQSVYKFKGVQI